MVDNVDEPAWLTVARKYLGFHETGNNQGLEHFISLAHTGEEGDPWCAIFVNACLEEAGWRGSRSARARSFERDSHFDKLTAPTVGCIVTRWRGARDTGPDGIGHVYFYLGHDANGIHALAGNEDDAVREYTEPASKVTGFWWPNTRLDGGLVTTPARDNGRLVVPPLFQARQDINIRRPGRYWG